MISICARPESNLLCVAFSGRVQAGHLNELKEELEISVAAMRPGFRVVTDLSELEEMNLDCAEEIQEMMTRFAKAGVREVVRIIPDPSHDIGFGIMSAFHYSPRVMIQTLKNRHDAAEILGEMHFRALQW